jgi:tRNA threonylcarbamoyladenosine biosynthesis protein TsaE
MVVKFTLDEVKAAAVTLLEAIGNRKVIAFHGEMSAGKTTFIHALCEIWGVKDTVSSPTFSIINEYGTKEGDIIYHIDLYRLQGEKETAAAGVEDCIYSGYYCLVEWPEKAPHIFPDTTVHCYLTATGEQARKLQINL